MRAIDLTPFFLNQLNNQVAEQAKYQQQISTGIEVLNPGDDPSRAGTIQSFISTIQRLERHQDRVGLARGFLESQETLLLQAQNLMVRAQEIAESGANETLDETQRRSLAVEVFGLRDAMVAIANTKYQGLYLFGGLDDDSPPFTIATAPPPNGYLNPGPIDPNDPAGQRYIYADTAITGINTGKNDTRTVQVSDTETVRMNTPGDQVFEASISALERLGRALDGYETTLDVVTGLPDGGGVAFTFPADYSQQSADIRATLDELNFQSLNTIIPEVTNIGARLLRLGQVDETLDAIRLSADTSRANIQDTDIVKAITKLTALNTSLEALFQSYNVVNDLSLLDFI